jgi:hypothetical protein
MLSDVLTVTLTGTEPLIVHNEQSADPSNFYAREVKKLTAKKTNKTDEDNKEIDRLSYLSALYLDPELGPYLPSKNFFRCMMEAGSITRDGKKIERGLFTLTSKAQIEYDGPRDAQSLWGDGTTRFVDRRLVKVGTARIPRVRPIFTDWRVSYDVRVDDEQLDLDAFASLAEKAGLLIGIGTFRRFYGKFGAEVTSA